MPFYIDPPLLNSANPWATTLDDLRALYDSPYTGAVTTRTCTLEGFAHDNDVHQYTFFNPETLNSSPDPNVSGDNTGSLNTLGYSPISLPKLVDLLLVFSEELRKRHEDSSNTKLARKDKPFIVSITGTPDELKQCYSAIKPKFLQLTQEFPIYIEINLSCPNISGKPPPAYSLTELKSYLQCLSSILQEHNSTFNPSTNPRIELHIGIKTPPYTNPVNFTMIRSALLTSAANVPISFITATNTLGSSLLLTPSRRPEEYKPTLNSSDGSGIGGLAGAPLHSLALGNVRALRKMLDSDERLKRINIIGIGGVSDAAGFRRMRAVSANAVGVGTALGRKGVKVFEEITRGLEKGKL